jgi:hypothetical protein
MREQIIDPIMARHGGIAQRLSGTAGLGHDRHSAFLDIVSASRTDLDQLFALWRRFPVAIGLRGLWNGRDHMSIEAAKILSNG